MNDKELADAVVALGVGESTILTAPMKDGTVALYTACSNDGFSHPKTFVRDWRVAGALMEKCVDIEGISYVELEGDHERFNESLPRAIIEACVEALS